MFETYLKRSGSVPLKVQICDPFFNLLESVAPHISRLSSLTVVVHDSVGFGRLARHLGNPIPTLNEFSIVGVGYGLTIPSDIRNDYFLSVKKLRLVQVSFLRAPRAFPHVTELVWIVKPRMFSPVPSLVDTMVELSALERVEIVFEVFYTPITPAHLVTLPNVQRMSLHCFEGEIPGFLEFLELPNLTSLVVAGVQRPPQSSAVLPAIPFGENLPNFVELPEMEVAMYNQQRRISFRSASQATLDYYLEPSSLVQLRWGSYHELWGGLPVDSIRRVVMETDTETTYGDGRCIVNLLADLRLLERLEFRSRCGHTPRYLHKMIKEGLNFSEMQTLTVYFGHERNAHRVHRLQDVADGLSSGISVTWTKDSEISDDEQ